MQVDAFAVKQRVVLYLDEDVKVARRTTAHAGFALTRQADAGAGFDAGGGDVHSQRAVFLHTTRAMAGLAGGVLDHLTHALTGRQVRSTVKKPCCARTLPMPEQVGHMVGSAPLSAPPVPLHSSQATEVGTLIVLCRPE